MPNAALLLLDVRSTNHRNKLFHCTFNHICNEFESDTLISRIMFMLVLKKINKAALFCMYFSVWIHIPHSGRDQKLRVLTVQVHTKLHSNSVLVSTLTERNYIWKYNFMITKRQMKNFIISTLHCNIRLNIWILSVITNTHSLISHSFIILNCKQAISQSASQSMNQPFNKVITQ